MRKKKKREKKSQRYLFIYSSSKCVPHNLLIDVHTNEYIRVHTGSTVILVMDVVEISVGRNTENIHLNLNAQVLLSK